MTGIVTGGWEFVTAAYGITFLVLSAYTVSLLLSRSWGEGDDGNEGNR